MRKRIVLGQIPENFDFKTHIPFGPMCFVGKESNVLNWEKNDFETDPFKNLDFYSNSENLCLKESYFLLEKIGNKLNNSFKLNFSINFWKIILFPWIPYTVSIAYEKQLRVENFIKKYKNQKLHITLLKDNIKWNFKNCLDFMNNGLKNPYFNEWLLSRIIETQIPNNWTTEFIDKTNETYNSFYYSKQSLIKKLIKKIPLLNLINGFHRVFEIYGFKFLDFIIFNIFLIFKKSNSSSVNDLKTCNNLSQIDWKYDIETLLENVKTEFISNLPDYIGKIDNKKHIKNKLNLISAAQITNSDNLLKVKFALKKEFGEKIISVQHGGHNYGTSRNNSPASLVEYNQDGFITWGWKEQEKYSGNFIALPSPFISSFYNRHKQTDDKIILVGNYMNPFFYCFQGYPNSNQLLKYRENKIHFIKNIKNSLFVNLFYRPYSKSPYSFQDFEYVKSNFNNINILEGNLHSKILSCRLLILDHPGTTLLIALSANIPFVCFWNKDHFPLSSQSESLYKTFYDLNIFFENSTDASEHVNNIKSVEKWWYHEKIQKARFDFLNIHAKVSKNWKTDWYKFLKTI